jgi:FMN-dependent NADH-azoreductase
MNILSIRSSIKGKDSQSAQLGQIIVDRLRKSAPQAVITYRNLSEEPVPHLNPLYFNSLFTPDAEQSIAQKQALAFSDQSIKELEDADYLVIEVPMYNFTIPSSLKAWIDHIIRAGVTFRYTEQGAEGLVKGKKVFLAISTGGIYSKGPLKSYDFTENYLRATLGMIGLTDIETFRVEGTGIPELKGKALAMAIQQLDERCQVNAY